MTHLTSSSCSMTHNISWKNIFTEFLSNDVVCDIIFIDFEVSKEFHNCEPEDFSSNILF